MLIPLLGISNVLQMIAVPADRTATEFAVWAFTSHFLSSFQGFMISFIYCFFNREVRISTIHFADFEFSKLTEFMVETQVQTILKKRWRCYRAKSISRHEFGASMKSRVSVNGDPLSRSLRVDCANSRRHLNQEEFTSDIRMSSYKFMRRKSECEEEEQNGNPTEV